MRRGPSQENHEGLGTARCASLRARGSPKGAGAVKVGAAQQGPARPTHLAVSHPEVKQAVRNGNQTPTSRPVGRSNPAPAPGMHLGFPFQPAPAFFQAAPGVACSRASASASKVRGLRALCSVRKSPGRDPSRLRKGSDVRAWGRAPSGQVAALVRGHRPRCPHLPGPRCPEGRERGGDGQDGGEGNKEAREVGG